MAPFRSHPFDDDKLKEECGIFGVVGVADASNFVALGLHALQHRGQEAGGIVSYHPDHGFNSARRFGYVLVPDGINDSALWAEVNRTLADGVTSRNMATVMKLQALCEETRA